MNIAICDDDPIFAKQLFTYISDYFNQNMIYASIQCFHSGEQLLAHWKDNTYTLLFLDIYMDKISGVDVARTLRKSDENVEIFFLTTSEEHFREGYECRVLEYLQKPVDRVQINRALERVQRLFSDARHYIDIVCDRTKIRIPQQSILWLEVYKHNTTLHTKQGNYTTRMTLSTLSDKLTSPPFYKISKSQIVNFQLTDSLEDNGIRMKDGSLVQIPTDSRYSKTIRSLYFDYLFSSGGDFL